MKKAVIRALAVLGGLYLLIAILVFGYGFIAGVLKSRIKPNTVLEADFESGLVAYISGGAVESLFGKKQTGVLDVVEALERAQDDERVWGLVARVGESNLGLAQIQELREAVLRFRSRGKKAIAWAETFGEFSSGNGSYYLATAFDEIYLQPSGDLGLTGLMYETPFISGALNKLKITPRFDHRHEYKNFKNFFTNKKFTPEHKEALEAVMKSQFSQIVSGISEKLGKDTKVVKQIINNGPYRSDAALELGLVNGLAYRDEVYDMVRTATSADTHFLYLQTYLKRVGSPWSDGETIALIYGVGSVSRGKSGFNPLFGSRTMGSDTITAAFRSAREDDDVKAIIFRVDTPGGSAVASDSIWRETERAKKMGKPVIVSMGNVAGSGGYWVSMNADKIVAHPGTITGSIGVLGGKMLMREFWERLGVTWDEVHSSTNSTMWSSNTDFSKLEWAKFQSWLDGIYDEFTTKVAEGRGLSKEKVLEIAKGRIWSGEDAKLNGLVDELGGLSKAIELAKRSSGIPADQSIRLKLFPKRRTLTESLVQRFLGGEEESSEPETQLGIIKALAPLRDAALKLGLTREQGVLVVPDYATGCCF
ncbi:MAG: signal peptide peptidase SppA [Candidatus Dadabacteria bacterium]|nr:signal peptide peptidase SppA [Candidatus Dadabacteria bacterium]